MKLKDSLFIKDISSKPLEMTSVWWMFTCWILFLLICTSPVSSGDSGGSHSRRGGAGVRNWETRCLEVGGRDVLTRYVREQEQLLWCIISNVNIQLIQEEVESRKKTGDIDEFFANYCRTEIPTILGCISRFLSVSQECLVPRERAGLNTSMAMVEAGLDYICHNQGERLALFMASKGLECVTESRDAMLSCVHSSPSLKRGQSRQAASRMHFYVFQKENCRKGDAIISCVEKTLLECGDPTPANLVDGLLHAMKAETPCPSLAPPLASLSCFTSFSLLVFLLRAAVL